MTFDEDIGTVVEPVGEKDVEKSSVSATDSESEDNNETQKEEKPLWRTTRITAGVPPKGLLMNLHIMWVKWMNQLQCRKTLQSD